MMTGFDRLPAVVEKVTGTDVSGFPLMSSTFAVIVVEPPSDETVAGLALTFTRPTPAEPTAIFTTPLPTFAAPDIAEIVAVPDWVPARKVTDTRPAESVRASDGSTDPSDVVKVTSVPLWGGVPDCSMTWAMMVAVPFVGRAVAVAVRVMLEPAGARRGTFSQATDATIRAAAAATRTGRKRAIIKSLSILKVMERSGQAGYAMAALLVAMSVMAIMMTVAMPVWKQTAQREKEEELIWRGQQYQRAIGLFGRKFANAFPPNLDVLVDQKFLRRKYKDPITGDDFLPLLQGQQGTTPGSGSRTAATPGRVAQNPTNPATPADTGLIGPTASGGTGTRVAGSPMQPVGAARGGIIGVVSKSKAKSIRLYNGRSHYNEWAFIFTQQNNNPGGIGSGLPGARPGQRNPTGTGTTPATRPNPLSPTRRPGI
jgi:type II secretory pathway pseudopilin PulG